MSKDLVVISGKGGTGKTSVVASFAALAPSKVMADCDVDAADLHLVLSPQIKQRENFSGGSTASIVPDDCIACGRCQSVCKFGAVSFDGPANDVVNKTYRIDPISCEGCGLCAYFCPTHTINFAPSINGEWYISETRYGPMVHAKLGIAEENSGKLVTLVRRESKRIADENGLKMVIVDGSPGIGCPVIASIAGASLVLIVTEPTMSGLHDLDRVADLAKHFGIPAGICINKWDINPDMTAKIEAHASGRKLKVFGRISYDSAITQAQIAGQSVVEFGDSISAREIRTLWSNVEQILYS